MKNFAVTQRNSVYSLPIAGSGIWFLAEPSVLARYIQLVLSSDTTRLTVYNAKRLTRKEYNLGVLAKHSPATFEEALPTTLQA